MTVQVGVGTSTQRNPEVAGQEAVAAALKNAGISECDLVMVFSTVGYDQPTIVETVREAAGGAPLVGCSGEGVIAQGVAEESSHGLTVMVWKSDTLKFKLAKVDGLSKDTVAAGASLAKSLGEVPSDALALFLFPDGLTFNFDRFMDGMSSVVPGGVKMPVVGGTAGDNFTLTKTYQYLNDEVVSDGAVAALLYGAGEFAVDVSHGCIPIGAERQVTKHEGNMVFEIDGKPALDVMGEYLSEAELKEFGQSTISLCLGFKDPAGGDEYIIRGIPGKDDEAKAFALYADVPSPRMSMTRRDPDRMMKGIDELVGRMSKALKGEKPSVVLQFECLGRGKNMFREEEKMGMLSRLQETLGKDTPWIGFYCYGEIAPAQGRNNVHNYTSVVAAIR